MNVEMRKQQQTEFQSCLLGPDRPCCHFTYPVTLLYRSYINGFPVCWAVAEVWIGLDHPHFEMWFGEFVTVTFELEAPWLQSFCFSNTKTSRVLWRVTVWKTRGTQGGGLYCVHCVLGVSAQLLCILNWKWQAFMHLWAVSGFSQVF